MEETLNNPWPQWLLQTRSLTAALQETGATFAVEVLFQGESDKLCAHEYFCQHHYVREVRLLLDGIPVVWARSVCAAQETYWRNVLDCGNRSLGARLFGGQVQAVRSPFHYFAASVPGADTPVWIRCSRFDYQGKALLLSEAFLPALAAFLPANPAHKNNDKIKNHHMKRL